MYFTVLSRLNYDQLPSILNQNQPFRNSRLLGSTSGYLGSIVLSLILLMLTTFSLDGQRNRKNHFDGPYIFQMGDSIQIQWVEGGFGYDTMIACNDAAMFQRESLPEIDLRELSFEATEISSYTEVDKVVALSDIHGQYEIMITLLKEHGVIDDKLNWIFDKGHLVILGDNFDRGDRVLEILWFLFKLEKEALKAGGRVNVLMGNHEIMVLNGDLRYLNKKYYYTSAVFKTRYDQFFREGSVLGDWISNQKVLLSVNENLYVHGGVSPDILKLKLSLEEINQIFAKQLVRHSVEKISDDKKESLLYFDNGPLWYRGYFDTEVMDMKKIDASLKQLKQERIIVGHTSLDAISQMFEGKVIAIDCSIKLGMGGQVLIEENGGFYVGDINGNRSFLAGNKAPPMMSVYNYMTSLPGHTQIEITTDLTTLLDKSSEKAYQDAAFVLKGDQQGKVLDVNGNIRVRGESRREVCMIPPLKYNFSKTALNTMGFLNFDKLNLILPCDTSNINQEKLLKEYFLYELYQIIDSNALNAKLIDVDLFDGDQQSFQLKGILLEDEEEYAWRNVATLTSTENIKLEKLDRGPFAKFQFFQFMIANTDWSIEKDNNVVLINKSNSDKTLVVPYDFDFSGFVNQAYAVPDSTLFINNVHQRSFKDYSLTAAEFDETVVSYLDHEASITKLCETATYLSPESRNEAKSYLTTFFDLLHDTDQLKAIAKIE